LTQLTETPRTRPAAGAPAAPIALDVPALEIRPAPETAPETRPAPQTRRATAPAPAPANPRPSSSLLRHIASYRLLAEGLPARAVQAMASELLAFRALDAIADRAERATRRADAIADALRVNFTLTGKPDHTWRVDTVADVLIDHLADHGWPDITRRAVHETLAAIGAAPNPPLRLDMELGRPVLRGLHPVGAPT